MSAEDGRIITDIVVASLIASALRLIVQKAFLEPAAAWIGQTGLKSALRLLMPFASKLVSKSPSNQDESRV